MEQRCDSQFDCIDGSDEIECKVINTPVAYLEHVPGMTCSSVYLCRKIFNQKKHKKVKVTNWETWTNSFFQISKSEESKENSHRDEHWYLVNFIHLWGVWDIQGQIPAVIGVARSKTSLFQFEEWQLSEHNYPTWSRTNLVPRGGISEYPKYGPINCK